LKRFDAKEILLNDNLMAPFIKKPKEGITITLGEI
jgi:hypothetical protein